MQISATGKYSLGDPILYFSIPNNMSQARVGNIITELLYMTVSQRANKLNR